jgi:hypothetical protein
MRIVRLLSLACALIGMTSCGGSGNNSGGNSNQGGAPLISSVTVNCSATSLQSGQQSQCHATVGGTNNANTAVTWTASAGTIDGSGMFTAPVVVPPTTVTITATSVQDSSKLGTASVSVTAAGTISNITVNCSPGGIKTGEQSQCTATVNGTGTVSQDVTWKAVVGLNTDCGGCMSSTGVVSGPKVDGRATLRITATSVQDPSKTGFYTLWVLSPGTVTGVSVSCTKTTISPGQDSLCTATVSGTGDYSNSVTWNSFPMGVYPSGVFVALSNLQTPTTATIIANSAQDNSVMGQATINIVAGATPNNVSPVVVDAGPSALSQAYINGAFATVTICVPGTDNCQTIDHVLVDTGSSGLRLLAAGPAGGEFTLPLAPVVDDNPANYGNAIVECAAFVSGFLWGPVARADLLTLSDGTGEQASNIAVQIIGQPGEPAVPKACTSSGTDASNLQALGANGILGVSSFREDCGSYCRDSFNTPNVYFSCGASGCSTMIAVLQVMNPVISFATDSQGVVMTFPNVNPPGAATLSGSLIYGINSQPNNSLGNALVLGTINMIFNTTYLGNVYGGFLDSGSNGYFFLNSQILGAQMPVCPGSQGWYCPASTQMFTVTNSDQGSHSGTVSFSVDNTNTLFQNAGYAVLPTLGGDWPLTPPAFDWGLPFFYGRTVFTAVEGILFHQNGDTFFGPFIAY